VNAGPSFTSTDIADADSSNNADSSKLQQQQQQQQQATTRTTMGLLYTPPIPEGIISLGFGRPLPISE
jgi:hypothetical protein